MIGSWNLAWANILGKYAWRPNFSHLGCRITNILRDPLDLKSTVGVQYLICQSHHECSVGIWNSVINIACRVSLMYVSMVACLFLMARVFFCWSLHACTDFSGLCWQAATHATSLDKLRQTWKSKLDAHVKINMSRLGILSKKNF